MYKKRLLKLAELLEADAGNRKGIKFDLDVVGHVAPGKVLPLTVEEVKLDCGTTACAMGLAALSGAFKRQGLGAELFPGHFSGNTTMIETTMHGKTVDFDDAAVELFDITMETATWLFNPSGYVAGGEIKGAKGERIVATRIRDLIDGNVKEADIPGMLEEIQDENY